MAMPPAAEPLSLHAFLANPDIHYYDFHELHHGEVVPVSPPSLYHLQIQDRLQEIFRSLLPPGYGVWREFYYTLPAEARRADVAVVREHRLEAQHPARTFSGSPDVLIEVVCPSNTVTDLSNLRRACIAADTEQFWICDPFEKMVEVYHRDTTWREYTRLESITFQLAGSRLQIAVDRIFE